jgi:Na+-transporting NADH:ubiquinone oxidoreductase subunit NqrC
MPKPKLYWVRETEDEDTPRLTDIKSGAYVECEPAKLEELDSHDVSEFLDMKAEQENRHELVGMHTQLASIVRKAADDEAADAVMLEILKRGGLWNL